jgi:hypothetical protein
MAMWGTVRLYLLVVAYFLTRLFFPKGCWVLKGHRTNQLLTEYVWQWTSVVLMFILYIIMSLVLVGWLSVEKGVWQWNKNSMPTSESGVEQPKPEPQEEYDSRTAKLLLL